MGGAFKGFRIHNRVNYLSHEFEIIRNGNELFEVLEHPTFKRSDPTPALSLHSLRHPLILESSDYGGQRVKVAQRITFLYID